MQMDLWYDLAVRGNADLTEDPLERLLLADADDQAWEPEPEAALAVDFF